MEPVFLTLEEVLFFHRSQIEAYGGSHGVRDLLLLQSALAQPQATFGGQFLHSDLHEMAAAYLFHIVQNHPFIDGNKRVGLEAALAFLGLNGVQTDADEDALTDMVLSVAQGQAGKQAIAAFLKKVSRKG